MNEEIAMKICGPAGAGIIQAGEVLGRALARMGLRSLVYPEYQSRIRGGDNSCLVIFSQKRFLAPKRKVDLLLALEEENYKLHKDELKEKNGGFQAGNLGLDEIGKMLGNPLTVNMAGVGFLWGILGFDYSFLEKILEEEFGDRKEMVVLNRKASWLGYEKGKGRRMVLARIGIKGNKGIISLSGNEALFEGMLAGGLELVAIYPMTPINSILSLATKSRVKLFRPEDEIAGVMAAMGSWLAGKRAAVATSGGGFSLMVEGLGMAGMAEIPLVVVLGQRTGPSTGMATWTSQADLNFAIFAGQGEFPRIVLAPGDLAECKKLGREAFELAERYQVPVILLTDKYLGESRFSAEEKELEIKELGKVSLKKEWNNDYKRYELKRGGISLRLNLGEEIFWTNSYEHDEYGFTNEKKENRERMMKKRMSKLRGLEGGVEGFEGIKGWHEGVTLVGWGSTKQILGDFWQRHRDFNFLHFWRVWPFPDVGREILKKAQKIVVVEENYSGQLAFLIEREILKKVMRVVKDDGRPFYQEELEDKLKEVLC